MNTSVALYAPKNKTYSTIKSLDDRVVIAAGIQILGSTDFWIWIFTAFVLDMDDNLLISLQQRDNNKTKLIIMERRENEEQW